MIEENKNENLQLIIVFSLVSGILILVSSFSLLVQNLGFGFMQGMMGGMMGLQWMFNVPLVGISSGIIIIFSSIMMNIQRNTQIYGILVLIFAVISLLTLGVFIIGIIGAILGIIAGMVAISRR